MRDLTGAVALVAGIWAGPLLADTAEARCDIYPKGEDRASASVGCTFGQRQGHITITREDGISHDLRPEGEVVGNFLDANGDRVFRQSGLGDAGLIFRFPTESLFLYWGGVAEGGGNATAPFSTDDYDATAILRCRAVGHAEAGSCPAGVARMEDQQASVTVQDPSGSQFTLNFMKDSATGMPYVNAANREVEAEMQGDTWIVTIDGAQVYEVPEVMIVGD